MLLSISLSSIRFIVLTMNELKVPKQVLCDFLITNGVKNRGALESHIKTNYGIGEEYLKAVEDKLTYFMSTFEK